MFAAKLMWRHLPDLRALAGDLPEYAGLDLHELLTMLLRDPRYVWMTRRDKVRQAVSLWRALQTRNWRLAHPRQEHSATSLRYSFAGIEHLVRSLTAEDESWGAYFARHGLDPVTVVYEDDLEPDRNGTVETVLAHLGVAAPSGWEAPEPMHRQADQLSEDWVTAYHRDLGDRDAGRSPVASDSD